MDTGAVVRAHIDAFNAGDVDGLVSGFSDGAVFVNGTTRVVGHAELARFFGAAIRHYAPSLAVDDLIVAGDRAACELIERLEVDGTEQAVAKAAFYRVEDGLIVSGRVYIDDPTEA